MGVSAGWDKIPTFANFFGKAPLIHTDLDSPPSGMDWKLFLHLKTWRSCCFCIELLHFLTETACVSHVLNSSQLFQIVGLVVFSRKCFKDQMG